MYIKHLVIYGYGKWENQTIDLTDGFVAFLGANEMGKSTLQSFIQHMLFGLPKATRKKDVNLYIPKTNSRYGGQLVLDDTPYGLVTIERVRTGKTIVQNKITTQDGMELTQDALEKMLGGLTIELYEQFFSIQLQQLQALNAIEKDALNRYFLTVGLSGSESLFEWYDSWLQASDKLYRPSASKLPLNEKLERYREQVELVDRLATQQETYGKLSVSVQEIETIVQQLKTQEQELSKQLHELEKIQQLLPNYEQHQKLVSKPFQTTHLETDMGLHYKNLIQQKELLEEQLLRAKDRLTKTDVPEELVWFRKHEKEIKYAVMSLPKVEQTLKVIANADYQIELQQDALNHACHQIDVLPEQLPEKEIVLTNEAMAILDSQQQIATSLKHQAELVAQLEERIDNERIQHKIIREQREQYLMLYTEQGVSASQSFRIAYLIAVIGLVVSGGLAGFGQLVLAIVGAVLSGIVGVIGWMQGQSQHKAKQQREEQLQLRLQQYDDRLFEKEQLMAVYQQEQQSYQQHYQQLEETSAQLNRQLLAYKQANNIPETIDLLSVKNGKMSYVYALKSKISELNLEKNNAIAQLQMYDDIFAFFDHKIESHAPYGTLMYQRERLTQFKQFVDTWQVEDYKLQQSNLQQVRQEKDIVALQETYQSVNNKLREVFDKAGVQSVVEFEKLLELQRIEQQELQELTVLKEHLGDDLSVFNQFDSANITILVEQQRTIREQQHDYLTQLAKLKQELAFLEQDGQFSEEKQRLAILEQAVIQEIKQVGAYQLAAKMVEMILQQGKSQSSDTIITKTSQLFSRITENRYTKVMFVDDVLHVKRSDNQVFALYELSTGTLDQLYIALRLAFISSVQDRVNVPLIIDDCFVNFDATRKQVMLNILKDYATQQQIIYLTYDTSIHQQGVHVVELSQ